MTQVNPAAVDESVYRRIAWRLLPLLMTCYVLAQIDRKNVAFAQLEMGADLGLTSSMFGFGAGIFFIGFLCAELPSSYLLTRIGVRKTVTRIMLLWGLMSCVTAFVRDAHSFYVVRFLLGAAEAGFFPAIILYLALWFPQRYQGRAVAMFMSAAPIASLISSPLSGAIMRWCDGIGGLTGWQWLFLLEGFPPILLAFVVFFAMPDAPATADWLTADEKQAIRRDVSASQPRQSGSFFDALKNSRTYFFGLTQFAIIFGSYVIGFWAPSMVKAAGVTSVATVGFLVAIPYAFAIVAMIVVGKYSDRAGNRIGYCSAAMVIAAIAFMLIPAATSVWLTIVVLCLASVGMFVALSAFWAIPSSYLRGAEAAGGVALISFFGALGGFASPVLVGWLKDHTGSFAAGCSATAAVLIVGMLLLLSGAKRSSRSEMRSPAPT